MDVKLSPDELRWLRELDTDSLVKPQVPAQIAQTLVEHGFAITLVEGGLQLTALGREQLERAS
jgi:hypothetical protein